MGTLLLALVSRTDLLSNGPAAHQEHSPASFVRAPHAEKSSRLTVAVVQLRLRLDMELSAGLWLHRTKERLAVAWNSAWMGDASCCRRRCSMRRSSSFTFGP